MSNSPQITASELVLSAIFFLQQKNGATATEITKFICSKRKCKPGNVKGQVKKALDRAIKNGMFSRKRGLYIIENNFGEKLVKGKEGRQGGRKTRAKKARTRVAMRNIALNYIGCNGGSSSLDNKSFRSGIFTDRFPLHKLKVLENKIRTSGSNEERLSSSDNRADSVSLKGIKRGVAEDNEEYDDEDFLEEEDDEDDDEVDYFADEHFLRAEDVLSSANFRKKSPATDKLSFFENETDAKPEEKERIATKKIDAFIKRKRLRTSDDRIDEISGSSYVEDRSDRHETNGNRTNKTSHKSRFIKINGNETENDNASESNFSEDSDERSRGSSEYKRSKASLECSDNENTSGENLKSDRNKRHKENNVRFKGRQDCPKESQQLQKIMRDEFVKNYQESFQLKNKDQVNEKTQLEKQSALQKSNEENPKDSVDLHQMNIIDSEKQTLFESEASIPRPPLAQQNSPSADGGHSRSSRWEPKEKLLRSNRRRTAKARYTSEYTEQSSVKEKAGKWPGVNRALN